jgi:hypothetical protein
VKIMDKLSVGAFLLAIMFTGGLAWAQVGDMNPNEPEKPFLVPYSPEYQSLNASQNPVKPQTKSPEKASLKPENIAKKGGRVISTNKFNASLGKSAKMKNQSAGTEMGVKDNSLSLSAGDHCDSGSKSFLDGYFLKSLHEDNLRTKKPEGNKITVDNIQKNKNRSSLIKENKQN